MTQCQLCRKRWPDHLVQTLFTTHGNIAVDPICGLEEIRRIHQDPTLEFSGEHNLSLYREAMKRQAKETS